MVTLSVMWSKPKAGICARACVFFLTLILDVLKFTIHCLLLMQEVVFYEDGEPILDGETGDLKVSIFSLGFLVEVSWLNFLLIVVPSVFGSSVFVQNLMMSSEGKEMTCVQLLL